MTSRMYREFRGRPRGESPQDYYNLESIILIARKYNLDPKLLMDLFLEAFDKKISQYGGLEISCREVNQDSAIFLITEDEKAVWQFPLNLESIRNPHFRDSIKDVQMPQKVEKINGSGRNLKISELRFGMKGINVTAKIIEIPPASHVFTRWESEASVSNVKLADETGSVALSLWNDQIKMVHVGDEVEIKNCSVSRFANNTQLRLGRTSTLSVIKLAKCDNSLSLKDRK